MSTDATSTEATTTGVFRHILIDNDDVRVTRVTIPPGLTHAPDEPRMKRVVVFPTPHHTERTHEGNRETLFRAPGDAVWREASAGHTITNRSASEMVTILVELKR